MRSLATDVANGERDVANHDKALTAAQPRPINMAANSRRRGARRNGALLASSVRAT
jgi:hypothetical protein